MTYWQERIKINVNSDLLHFFETFGDNRVRVIKINFRNDYENFTSLMLVRKQPCFLLFRLDDSNESEYKWILISWIPEDSTVKQKGMFVLTEATLKEAFGRKQIKGRLLVTTANEAHIDNVKRILSYEQPLPPLLSAAKELMMAKALEVYNGVSQNAQLTEINGLIFPISTDAIEAVKELKDKIVNYVQLKIDLNNETIHLELKGKQEISNIVHAIPKDHARYHLLAFSHLYNGDNITSIVFIFTVPGFDCSIKERMLYSCGKKSLLYIIENIIGMHIEKKIEIDDPAELTTNFLVEKIHPKTLITKLKFSKPKPPHHCGPRKLIKRT